MALAPIIAGVVGVLVGSLLNRLIVREPGYVITDPGDLPDDADESLLDELEEVPELAAVPVVALARPSSWWRRWFPATELVTAGVFALTAHRIGTGAELYAVLFLAAALVTLSAIDLRVYRIPDRVNFPAMGVGLASIAVVAVIQDEPGALVGALAGGLSYATVLFLAHIAYPRGMGFGDVKLAWLMGFYLGWRGWMDGSLLEQLLSALQYVLLGAAIGSFVGVVIGGGYALIRRSARVVFPYGPSLAIGCLIVLLWSDQLT
ncbi:MAG: A24 family peptidase [Acidimicrobiales bacterium]|nr:A24 family peptidase [Acidimicrobiales bacterium]